MRVFIPGEVFNKNTILNMNVSCDVKLCVLLSGMDTQLVVRPLLDKVEKNTQESAMRRVAFPHVSTCLVESSIQCRHLNMIKVVCFHFVAFYGLLRADW